jgi:hypothetical protein
MVAIISWLGKNWIALLALIISIISAWFSCEQNSLSKRIAHLHLDPVVEPMFDLPAKGNPIFVVTNQGDIPVASLSVSHKIFTFDSVTRKIVSAIAAGSWLGKKIIFKEELKPTEFVSSELIDISGPINDVSVYLFNLKYYRFEDMEPYENEIIYFVRGRQVFDHRHFRKDPLYPDIIDKIGEFAFPDNPYDSGKFKEVIQAWEKSNPTNK